MAHVGGTLVDARSIRSHGEMDEDESVEPAMMMLVTLVMLRRRLYECPRLKKQ